MQKKVCVIGLGYIGLPTAALLADNNFKVLGVDVIEDIVNSVNNCGVHIVEPELDIFVRKAVTSGNLVASTEPAESDVFMIAVPTPFHKGFVPNIDYVLSASESIAPYLKSGDLVILESTSPVGTTEQIESILKEKRPDLFPEGKESLVFLAHCPERVLPGQIMRELVENDRIVGGITATATKAAAAFYKEFVKGDIHETDAKTAEMAKLTENSFRDLNIAFANELSILCDKLSINVWELIRLANKHPRVNILKPGTGVGGHCIEIDPWFIVHAGGDKAKIIRTAREVNNYKAEWVIEKTISTVLRLKETLGRKPKIACLGLAFKPDIDDLRESPALYVAKRLAQEFENTLCVEPNVPIDYFLKNSTPLKLVTLAEAEKEADIFIFLVAHKDFVLMKPNKEYLDFCGVIANG